MNPASLASTSGWRPVVLQSGLLLMFVAVACHRRESTPSPREHPTPAAAGRVVSSASSEPSSVALVNRTSQDPSPAESLIHAWSAVLAAKDSQRLIGLYAPAVLYFGVWRSPPAVAKLELAAESKLPHDWQRSDKVQISGAPPHYEATYDEGSGVDGGAAIARRVVLQNVGDRLQITEESDSLADARATTRCSGMAFYVLNHQPAVAQHYRAILRNAPRLEQSSRVDTDDARNMTGASGFDHELEGTARFETHFWVEVASGHLTAKNSLTTASVAFTREDLDRVARACDGSRAVAPRE